MLVERSQKLRGRALLVRRQEFHSLACGRLNQLLKLRKRQQVRNQAVTLRLPASEVNKLELSHLESRGLKQLELQKCLLLSQQSQSQPLKNKPQFSRRKKNKSNLRVGTLVSGSEGRAQPLQQELLSYKISTRIFMLVVDILLMVSKD